MFHAKVEWAATWLELSASRPRYLRYKAVYDATRFTSEWLEEALANWTARAWLERNIESLQTAGLLQDPESVIRVVEGLLDFSPSGYRDWRDGYHYATWGRLANEVARARVFAAGASHILPLEGLLRGDSLFDLQCTDVPLFFHGRGVVADLQFGAPSRRELIRVLSRCGYQAISGRGKGSHELYRGPDNRGFPVPLSDPVSVEVFHKLLRHFGWTKQQYLTEVRAAESSRKAVSPR